ncbi:triosephosphate isomerase [Friedmanniella luteola]|uniref:Triosephosphate isomerase n=1 Tax=Friedmanniella luteola TaxID=546871 RepID=A0A1H1ZCY6_9ACTN|nr:triose-phosphate isomerase [Friedmanniella luteola]SDT31558.1 triosephosphate isomerase [Friedmanniella luteola]
MTSTVAGGVAAAAPSGSPYPAVPPAGTLWVGTSWKMNKTLGEAAAFVDALVAAELPPGVQPFVLPAHTALAHVRDRLPAGSPVLLGAQNAHWGPEGAGTGEISMRMAADAGARLVEMGHSERRADFGETDRTVALKAAAALRHGLLPLICVGEPLEVREAGGAADFVAGQVRAALAEVGPDDVGRVLVAYEPIWAIGEHGRPATQDQIAPVMALIVEVVAACAGGGSLLALLYGGGVHPDNAEELLTDPSTDGLFVGRAGWDVQGYLRLLQLCAPFARPRF